MIYRLALAQVEGTRLCFTNNYKQKMMSLSLLTGRTVGLNIITLSWNRGLPVGFLLLRYSVLCTFESLSLLYLLFIS